jgi:nitrate/nitrite transporter NarK
LLFGAGEAGAYPNISRSFARWFPPSERGFAHGIVFMGSRIGGAFAPPLVVLIMGRAGWRSAFFVFASFGVIWAVFWWRWFRDRPEDHPAVSPEELASINAEPVAAQRPVAWRDLMNANLLALCLMYFCVIYGLYFYLTWLPTYFKEARGYTTEQAAGLSSLVLLTGGLTSIGGGWLTDRFTKRYGLKIGRSVGAVALPLAGLALITAALTSQPMLAAVCFALATAMGDLTLSPSWSMCHDIGGDAAGRVSGAMNTFGNLGGALSPLVVGYALKWTGKWEMPLIIGGVVYVLGGLLTLLINPRRSIVTR